MVNFIFSTTYDFSEKSFILSATHVKIIAHSYLIFFCRTLQQKNDILIMH